MTESCFIHVDLDAFYASVEQNDNPEYKGKPVIVGSLPTDRRGVVSTCSYEARSYGVHSAMPIITAVKLCPHAIFLRGRMKRYQEVSKEIMEIFSDYSPDVHQISVDEAFIDITGTERLFGKPQDLANKLKQRVLEQTGLTVSVGISTTKYIAKIASGMKKPNGLYIVQSGNEESFMQSLPLKDIWGIGHKTIRRINEAGFFTSQDIYKASQGMLINLFGNSTGIFLYNAVRGIVHEVFNEPRKTRSISSERTFSFDLTDRYAIDTALMELSWDVMFRVFTEKWTSKTAHIKIRYEDFSTVSVQETSTRNISSADDLYSRAKKLFDKKYENGRGIRLIGIAAQNLEDKALPTQQELFDSEDKKKIAVEKTVIEMQKKNPGLQIKKARLLKTFLTTIFITLTSLQTGFTQNANIMELALPFENAFISGEAPIAMFNISQDSSQVEFFAQGTWDAMFTGFMSISGKKENNYQPSFSFDPPLFMQETDLTVWFLLQDTWYFEANIADNYSENTVAAGYYGEGLLKHARIGNRHITFSQNYGVADVNNGFGSGSNQAPGIMTQWEGDDWKADIMLRYDVTEPMEKTWIGQYEATENTIELTQWEKGARFIFPDNAVETIQNIYVESSSSSTTLFSDSQGKTYKKLSQSEYLLIPSKNMLVLDSPTQSNVLITFFNVLPELGTYNPPTGFKGDIQNIFEGIHLEDYSLNEKDSFTTIDGKNALVAQSSNFFSPFIDASLYSLSSFSEVDSVTIQSKSSGVTDKEFGTILLDANSPEVPGFGKNDIFDERRTYIQVYNKNEDNIQEAEARFPFAQQSPQIYLNSYGSTSVTQTQNDTIITVQSLTNSSVLDIGTDAISGSITVYRNGITENLFKYDSNTGLITLTRTPSSFDTIRITWQENTENSSQGSLTAATGFEKNISDSFNINASSSFLWPIVQQDAFSDASISTGGSFNIAIDANYEKNDFSFENTLYTSIHTSDVTNTYRIDGMDSFQGETIYLASDSNIALPENFTPILNQRPNETALMPILQNTLKGNISSETLRDSEQGGYIVQSEWNIEESYGWVSQTIDLKTGTSNLPSAQAFSINIKQSEITSDFKIYLQLGVSTDEDELFEKENEIPTWEITSGTDVKKPFIIGNTNWQTVSVYIKDEDRAKLTENQNVRLIILAPNMLEDDGTTGILQVGSYEVTGNSFSISNNDLYAEEVHQVESGKPESSEMTRFNTDIKNTVQYFKWDTEKSITSLSAVKFLKALPFSSYENFNFFAYLPETVSNESVIRITLEGESEFTRKEALDVEINGSALNMLKDSWQMVTLNLLTQELYIGKNLINKEYYTIHEINQSVSPTKIIFNFVGTGEIYIDELHFTEAIWEFTSENITNFEWERNETLVAYKDISIFSNAKIASNIRAGVSKAPEIQDKNAELGLVSDTNASIDILGITTEGSIAFSSSNTEDPLSNNTSSFYIESASHLLSSTPVFNIFKIFAFEEEYRYLPQSNAAKKSDYFSLDFSPFGANSKVQFLTQAEQEYILYTQDASITADVSIKGKSLAYTLNTNVSTAQNGYEDENLRDSYTQSWYDISKLQFSTGKKDAQNREVFFSLNQVFDIIPIKISPTIYGEAGNSYLHTYEAIHSTSDMLRFELPYTIGNHTFSTKISKTSYSDKNQDEVGNYFFDVENLIVDIQNRSWSYTAVPIYDFFDSTIRSKMQESITLLPDLNALGYTSELSLEWQRSFYANTLDIFIPTSAQLSFLRDIRVSSIDTNDIFQITGEAGFLSVNNFGKYGSIPLFNWYEQDEIIQSLQIAYEIDNTSAENSRIEVAGYNQISVYFSDSDRLTNLVEGNIDTGSDWALNIDTVWERKGKSSLVVDGLFKLFPMISKNYNGFTRENSLYVRLAQSQDSETEESIFQQLYGITHGIEVDINEYATIGLDVGSEFFLEEDSFSMTNSLTVSGKLQF